MYLFEEYYNYKCPALTVGPIDPSSQAIELQCSDSSKLACQDTLLVLGTTDVPVTFRYHFGVRRAASVILNLASENKTTLYLENAFRAIQFDITVVDTVQYITYNGINGKCTEVLDDTLQFYRKSPTQLEVFIGTNIHDPIEVEPDFAINWVEIQTDSTVRIRSFVAAEEVLSIQEEDFEIEGPNRFLVNSLVTYTTIPGRYIWSITPTKSENQIDYTQTIIVGPLKITVIGVSTIKVTLNLIEITDGSEPSVEVFVRELATDINVAVPATYTWQDLLILLNDYSGPEQLLVTATDDTTQYVTFDTYTLDVDITANSITFRAIEEDLITITAVRVTPAGLTTKTRTVVAVAALPAVTNEIDKTLWLYLSDIWGRVQNRGIIEASWNAIMHKYTDYLMQAYQKQLTRGLLTAPADWIEMWVPVQLHKTITGVVMAEGEVLQATLAWQSGLKFSTDVIAKNTVYTLTDKIVSLNPYIDSTGSYFFASEYPTPPSFEIAISGEDNDSLKVIAGVPGFGTWVTYVEGTWREITIAKDLSVTVSPVLEFPKRYISLKIYPKTFVVSTGVIVSLNTEVAQGDILDGHTINAVHQKLAVLDAVPTKWELQRTRSLPVDADYVSDFVTSTQTIPGYLFHKSGSIFICDKQFSDESGVLPYIIKSNGENLYKYFGAPMGLPLLEHSGSMYKKRLLFLNMMYLYPHRRNVLLTGLLALLGTSTPTKDLTVTAISNIGGLLTIYTEEEEILQIPKVLLKKDIKVGDTLSANQILVDGVEVQEDTTIKIIIDSKLVLAPQYVPSVLDILQVIQPIKQPLQLIFKVVTSEDLTTLPVDNSTIESHVWIFDDWVTDDGGIAGNPGGYTQGLDLLKSKYEERVLLDTDGWTGLNLAGAFAGNTDPLYNENYLNGYSTYSPTWYDGVPIDSFDRFHLDKLDMLAPADRILVEIDSNA